MDTPDTTGKPTDSPERTVAVTISTAHMTEDDNDLLSTLSEKEEWQVYSGGTGFFVWAGERKHIADPRYGPSKALLDALGYAKQLGYDWVRFDRDGEQVGELQTHKW